MFGNGRGLKLATMLHKEKIKTNVTCLMTTNQVLLAASIRCNLRQHLLLPNPRRRRRPSKSHPRLKANNRGKPSVNKIIVGSIRTPDDVAQAAAAGAHIITITPKVLAQMPFHQKTEDTIKEFDQAWTEFKKAEAPLLKPLMAS